LAAGRDHRDRARAPRLLLRGFLDATPVPARL